MTKVNVIRNNSHKYSVSAMCDILNIPKSTYYHQFNNTEHSTLKIKDHEFSIEIIRVFKESRNNYATRKVNVELAKHPFKKQISRRRIRRIMHELGLVSNYTIAQFKLYKSKYNEAPIKNELDRQFVQEEQLAVIISDLTYVRVGSKYIIYACL